MARRSRKSRRRTRKVPITAFVIFALGAGILLILLYILPGRYRLYQTTLYDPLEEAAENPLMGFAPDAGKPADCEAARLVTINLSWKDWEPQAGEYDTESLKKNNNLRKYREDKKHAVLRFDCKPADDGEKRSIKKAIRALGEYFSKDTFVSFIELDEDTVKYSELFREAFPHAFLLAPAGQDTKDGAGVHFDNVGVNEKQKKELSRIAYPDSWKKLPYGGSFSSEKKKNDLLNKDLSDVLQQIRDGHITYLSGKCPDVEEQKGNGYRMISQTLGYCIYISRLQTVMNFRKDQVTLRFTFKNTGVAPCYANWPVIMTVYSHAGKKLHEVELPMQMKDISPEEDFEVVGAFPYNKRLTKGYSIGIRIHNPEDPQDYITLSQKETKPDRYGEHIIYTYEPEKTGRKVQIARPDNYQHAMINLLADLSDYAKGVNSDFAMITNGGYKLYMPQYNTSEEFRMRLYATMDGMLTESVFYGWESRMNSKTPDNVTEEMLSAIKSAREAGLAAFNIEYCNKKETIKRSSEKSRNADTIWFNAPDMELTRIPALSEERENSDDCKKLEYAENFLTMLNPVDFSSKAAYLDALRDTDYDIIFIDRDFQGELLTRQDIKSLKRKKNGGSRMVCAYMSVGEAEDYRDYWQQSWNDNRPPWISEMNTEWEGNYKVMYWTKSWRDILFGTENSYLDKILAAGFDGVYLDVVDAYEYYEDE